MLGTPVKEIMNPDEFISSIEDNETVVICAGRLGPMCMPVYAAMEQMDKEEEFSSVKFMTVDFDTAAGVPIRRHEKCRYFMGLPFTAYYKNGEMVHATSSIQSKGQLEANVKEYLMEGKNDEANNGV